MTNITAHLKHDIHINIFPKSSILNDVLIYIDIDHMTDKRLTVHVCPVLFFRLLINLN